MRTILNHFDSTTPGCGHDGIHVARLAVQVGRNYRDGAGSDCRFKSSWIESECVRVDIGEDRTETTDASNFRNYPKRQRWENDLRTLRKIEGAEDVVKRHSAIRSSNGVIDIVELGKAFFERPYCRPLN